MSLGKPPYPLGVDRNWWASRAYVAVLRGAGVWMSGEANQTKRTCGRAAPVSDLQIWMKGNTKAIS